MSKMPLDYSDVGAVLDEISRRERADHNWGDFYYDAASLTERIVETYDRERTTTPYVWKAWLSNSVTHGWVPESAMKPDARLTLNEDAVTLVPGLKINEAYCLAWEQVEAILKRRAGWSE